MVRRRFKTGAAAFRRDDRGSTAMEFAFVAPVLFMALWSLIELGVLGMMITNVDSAVVNASRRIRTGRDDAASTAQAFKDQVCASMGGNQSECRERMTVSVRRFSRFADATAVATSPPDGAFDRGGPSDIVVVKVNYRWPLLTPYLGDGVGRSGLTEVTIAARQAFKNEPYG